MRVSKSFHVRWIRDKQNELGLLGCDTCLSHAEPYVGCSLMLMFCWCFAGRMTFRPFSLLVCAAFLPIDVNELLKPEEPSITRTNYVWKQVQPSDWSWKAVYANFDEGWGIASELGVCWKYLPITSWTVELAGRHKSTDIHFLNKMDWLSFRSWFSATRSHAAVRPSLTNLGLFRGQSRLLQHLFKSRNINIGSLMLAHCVCLVSGRYQFIYGLTGDFLR